VVNVDAAPSQFGDESVGQNLHVARQDNQISLRGLDESPELVLLLELGIRRDPEVVERNIREIEVGVGLAWMVRDDADQIHVQLADPPPVEEIGKAVVELGGKHENPLALTKPLDAECHGMTFSDGCETVANAFDGGARPDDVEDNAHEEALAFRIVKLVGVENVAAVLKQMSGDGGNDPWTIGA
jgi:hypothetical protein